MKKRKFLNVLMVISIVLTAMCGIMAVRSIKSPVTKPTEEVKQTELSVEEGTQSEQTTATERTDAGIQVQETMGIVTVERKGIAYEVSENSDVRTSDVFRTKSGSSLSLTNVSGSGFFLGADTELEVSDVDTWKASLHGGEVFADLRNLEQPVVLEAGGINLTSEKAVFTVSVQAAAYTVYIYAGEVEATGEGLKEAVTEKAGGVISILKDAEGNLSASAGEFVPEALNEVQLKKLAELEPDETFCVTKAEITAILEAREKEKEEAQKAQLLLIEQAKKELDQEQADYDKAVKDYVANLEKVGVEVKTDEEGNIVVEDLKYCTIEIRCDTILNNMGDLQTGKEGFVPDSGVILSTSQVVFNPGETVFDVLQRACSMAGIQLEYSWTPLYNSYYIEGINHLYEFDCGSQSGWMYKVNGWFPNYGCSQYPVNEGDTIVWCYTCKGLGADVGGSNF